MAHTSNGAWFSRCATGSLPDSWHPWSYDLQSTQVELESRGEQVIASPENISLHPSQIGRGSRRPRGGGLAALALRCRNYLAWHPVTAAFSLAIATAILLIAVAALVVIAVPSVNGWPIFTPQNGIVLALLLLTRRRHWPWIVLGYGIELSQGGRIVHSLPHLNGMAALGNLAEVCLAAFTLPPFRNLKQWLQEPRLLPAFLAYATLLGPVLMGVLNAPPLPGASAFWHRVGTIALADAIGMALASFLVLVLLNRDTYALFRPRTLSESFGLFALAAAATLLTLPAGSPLLLLVPTAVLIIIAFRLGLRAAVIGAWISAATALAAAHHTNIAPTSAQNFLALIVLAVLPIGVVLKNLHVLEDRLHDANGELDRLKSLDRLTGVPNRKRFDLVLDREWQRATRDPKPVALIMVDVDDFELYVKHYGPQAGDECLRRVAARMSEQPHRAYDLISRYEGGKFTVLLPGASGEAVERIAEEFRAEIAAQEWPHELSSFERVTVSVGWAAIIPAGNSSPAMLIAAADTALHLARENGKNRVEGVNANVDVAFPV